MAVVPGWSARPRVPPSTFRDVAISATGVSGVTLKNVNVKGWETGLHLVDARDWTIESCDFSDNFHDPDFGWGENGRRGGIVLERVVSSVLRDNRANRVWDGCVLVDSHDNRVEHNDFSHTSNTGLKLWTACRNTIRQNNLSYGLRIRPGEVHARDSSCVLIESGSNDNTFANNDCTHGGDGIFVRVLNGWVSTGNVFEKNDCSFANNNCIEAWSPRNTWIRNRANHGSYGFWLGASDQNVLFGNEASFNGRLDGMHNSPHLPDAGHAGIVFMFGPSSHTVIRANRCEGNNGAGIAAIGDLDSQGEKWKAFHWIVDQNILVGNRWGIYLQHAQMFDLAANQFANNRLEDIYRGANCTGIVVHKDSADVTSPPQAVMDAPQVAFVQQAVTFDASESHDAHGRSLTYRWQVEPAIERDVPKWSHTFTAPGFYRVALTVNNGLLSDLAWRDLYVVDPLDELGTEGSVESWSWSDVNSTVRFTVDPAVHLVGRTSTRADIQPYSGARTWLRLVPSHTPQSLRDKRQLVFWIKTINENIPAWQDVNPQIRVVGAKGGVMRLIPTRDWLGSPIATEAREGWTYFCVPLSGNQDWRRDGEHPADVKAIEMGFDSWGAPPLVIWIDGLGLQ